MFSRSLRQRALWNGAAVAAFGLSGEMLRQRFATDTLQTGLSVGFFGVGLAIGNFSVGVAKRVLRGDLGLLVAAVLLLVLTFAVFLFAPLPLAGALLCLGGWGVALGFCRTCQHRPDRTEGWRYTGTCSRTFRKHQQSGASCRSVPRSLHPSDHGPDRRGHGACGRACDGNSAAFPGHFGPEASGKSRQWLL